MLETREVLWNYEEGILLGMLETREMNCWQSKQTNDSFTKDTTMVHIEEKKPLDDYADSEHEHEE